MNPTDAIIVCIIIIITSQIKMDSFFIFILLQFKTETKCIRFVSFLGNEFYIRRMYMVCVCVCIIGANFKDTYESMFVDFWTEYTNIRWNVYWATGYLPRFQFLPCLWNSCETIKSKFWCDFYVTKTIHDSLSLYPSFVFVYECVFFSSSS